MLLLQFLLQAVNVMETLITMGSGKTVISGPPLFFEKGETLHFLLISLFLHQYWFLSRERRWSFMEILI